jgi:hypothetical protein
MFFLFFYQEIPVQLEKYAKTSLWRGLTLFLLLTSDEFATFVLNV